MLLSVPAPSYPQMADVSINPRHASQLWPIFVEHVARVHERAEKKCERNQQSILDKKRMCKRVLAFSFYKV
ncbi:hypothetical protein JVT61DRAFT_15478 [Boletus reticuloceps]|uniref:Uncharacterized protein n=1 Tax=Boletus reticuloceps TaxID=495285 RepID=A0A8I2YCF7_9AGAM|nr:hypothetical protein JVT61DRAFT_15478 [Boletus reticuloceps]